MVTGDRVAGDGVGVGAVREERMDAAEGCGSAFLGGAIKAAVEVDMGGVGVGRARGGEDTFRPVGGVNGLYCTCGCGQFNGQMTEPPQSPTPVALLYNQEWKYFTQ